MLFPNCSQKCWTGWAKQSLDPAGPPFIRYHVIDMQGLMDVEMGIPVASILSGDGRISPGVLPAGRYASLIYTGREKRDQRECRIVGLGKGARHSMGSLGR